MENTQLNQYSYDTSRNDEYVTFYFQEEGKPSERKSFKIPKAFFSHIKDRIALDREYEQQKEDINNLRDNLNDTRNKLRDADEMLKMLKDLHNDVLEILAKKLLIAKQNECHCQDYDRRW